MTRVFSLSFLNACGIHTGERLKVFVQPEVYIKNYFNNQTPICYDIVNKLSNVK